MWVYWIFVFFFDFWCGFHKKVGVSWCLAIVYKVFILMSFWVVDVVLGGFPSMGDPMFL